MADKRAETSADNGKLGGRPVSDATIRAQAARDYISKQVEDSLSAIVAKAIVQAIEGNADARHWLSDRSWGKAPINLGVDDEGKPVQGNAIAFNDYGDGKTTGK